MSPQQLAEFKRILKQRVNPRRPCMPPVEMGAPGNGRPRPLWRSPIPWGLFAAGVTGTLALAAGWRPDAACTAAVTVLCTVWWLTEAIPLAVTALVPIAVFPLAGVLTAAQTAEAFGNSLVLLFLGGFLLSRAMESSGAHRRLALALVHRVGSSGRRLVVGFTLASALASMWVSNTATVMILLPVAIAVLDRVDHPRLAICVLLGLTYGASIGGMATPIGSPPNLVFMRIYEAQVGEPIGFLEWMGYAAPVVVLMIAAVLLLLTRNLRNAPGVTLPPVGAWRSEERRVLAIFAATALAWITRTDPFGGWSNWLGVPGATDASVALLAAVALFMVPNGRGGRLLDWERARTIPWDVLILFAGGIAIAEAFTQSGLSQTIGTQLANVAGLPLLAVMFTICLGVTLLSEIASNTATAVLVLPVLAAVALATGTDARLLMLPAVYAASCGFMLPVATPPNAVVFGTGRIPIRTMVREGLALDLAGAAIISLVCYLMLG